MKILDLTHLIEEAMPVYPETEPPKLTPSNTFEQHGFRETLLTMGSHTGTHMDAPAHMLRDGKTLDQFPADKYIGTAYVLDCSDLAGKEIPKARLQLHASEIAASSTSPPSPCSRLRRRSTLPPFRSRASAPTPSPSTRWTRRTIPCTRFCSAQAL